MACTKPKKAWIAGEPTPAGKQKLLFKRPPGGDYEGNLKVPCGKCPSCKLSHAASWAIRGEHEWQTSKLGQFITLTYNDENLPEGSNLQPEHTKEFIKKLRRKLQRRVYCIGYKPGKYSDKKGKERRYKKHKDYVDSPIKYLIAGEYGPNGTHRPHYHIILFGYEFTDLSYKKTTKTGSIIYTSKSLEKLWNKGYSSIGEINFNTISYVARYTTSKATNTQEGPDGKYHYIKSTGELRTPEFFRMSRGIGFDWFKKYRTDTHKSYLRNHQGTKFPVPRYYDKKLEEIDPTRMESIKEKRRESAREYALTEGTPERLLARETEKQFQLTKLLKRGTTNVD